MAKATLELVIVDSGPPPVGAPAPTGTQTVGRRWRFLASVSEG